MRTPISIISIATITSCLYKLNLIYPDQLRHHEYFAGLLATYAPFLDIV